MNKNLTCHQVAALMNFYIEDKLTPKLREYIDLHIAKCPACRKKIEELKKILAKYNCSNQNKSQSKELSPITRETRNKLSAYIDNELNSNENIRIKKMAISNPTARKELETMYKFKKIIHAAYNKTKNDYKFDYSKNILAKIQDTGEYTTTYFYKLAAVFVVLISAIIVGFIYLYF